MDHSALLPGDGMMANYFFAEYFYGAIFSQIRNRNHNHFSLQDFSDYVILRMATGRNEHFLQKSAFVQRRSEQV